MNEKATQLKEKIKNGKTDEDIESTMMIPSELFNKKLKILFVLNICSYSKDPINFEDFERTVSYEDYAFYHLKSMAKYFHPDSEISIGHIDKFSYGYTTSPFSPISLVSFLAPIKNTNSLELEMKASKYFSQIYRSSSNIAEESITPLYQQLSSEGQTYDYVFYFTDGYPFELNKFNEDQATIRNATGTIFLLKGMSMSRHSHIFYGYAQNVTDPNKDIILNDKYYFPHYDEYFDRKESLKEIDKFIKLLEEN